jgi:C-terminal processing protease CtpA/Prc
MVQKPLSFALLKIPAFRKGSIVMASDVHLDVPMRSEIIEELLQKLHTYYIFPEVAISIEEPIRRRLSNDEYNDIVTVSALCEILTTHIQEISHDKHLRVFYEAEEQIPQEDGQENQDKWFKLAKLHNYGFEKVERLPGNIGYLDFRFFYEPKFAAGTAIAAMNFLAHTSALIIDLRKNHGGDPAMIALLCSYLFDWEPVHLNSLYWRADDSTQQFWTLPYVPGERYLKKPVYVLTSGETFSGAEEFTFNLKNLKRATIIGETTGGGAHPGDVYPIKSQISIFIPTGRAINPITKTNWEGTGVTPDIEVRQEQALKVAYSQALKKVLEEIGDEPKGAFQSLAEEVQEALTKLSHEE